MYLLDTNIVSFIPRDGENSKIIKQYLAQKLNTNNKLDLFISVITYQELMFGIEEVKRKNGKDYKKEYFIALMDFIKNSLLVLDYTKEMSQKFSKTQSKLLGDGICVDDFDIMIATTALDNDFTLVTNNTKDFENIPNLKLEDWTKTFKN
jgi:tRNA(fMet)-specific endonuclease VapC